MKTGKVARLFGKDQNTILDWSTRFAEFLTPEARKEGRAQRDYQSEDLVVINTIRILRDVQGVVDWEEIRARLAAGEREAQLPPEATDIQGEDAVTVYTNLKTLELRNEFLTKRIEELENDHREEVESLKSELQQEREKLQGEIRRLDRENAVLKYRLEQLEDDGNK